MLGTRDKKGVRRWRKSCLGTTAPPANFLLPLNADGRTTLLSIVTILRTAKSGCAMQRESLSATVILIVRALSLYLLSDMDFPTPRLSTAMSRLAHSAEA